MSTKEKHNSTSPRFLFNLKAFHKAEEHALSDLLPYALSPEPGFIVNKDGSYMVTWEYMGGDEKSMTALERDQQMMYINKAMTVLGSGWMYHINCIRHRVDVLSEKKYSHFSSGVTELIEEERREYFNQEGNSYKSSTYLTLTFLPVKDTAKKTENFFFDVEGEDSSDYIGDRAYAEEHLRNFKEKVIEFENILTVAFRLRRLSKTEYSPSPENSYPTDEHLNFLNDCATGVPAKMHIPYPMSFLDAHIGKTSLATGTIPKLGDQFMCVMNIDGFPGSTHAGIINQLSDIGFEFRWSTRFIPVSQWEAEKIIKKYIGNWKKKAVGFLNFYQEKEPESRDGHADAMHRDANNARSMNSAGNVSFGYYTGNIVLYGKDLETVEEHASIMKQALLSLGITNSRVENVNAVEAYLGSLPGNGFANIRRPILHTENLADLIPSSSVYSGLKNCPNDKYPSHSPCLATLKTDGNTPFWLNLHVSDVGHTLIFGPTGTGKSVLLAFLAMQMDRYKNCKVYSFDKGMSMFTPCMAVQGNHYEVGVESAISTNFSPLSNLSTHEDQEWAAGWVESLMVLQGVKPTIDHKQAIRQAIKETVLAKQNEFSFGEEHRLSEFAITVQDADVKRVLDFYTELDYYNAAEDGMRDGNFQCFEIEELMNLPDSKSLPILLYIFRIIERSLKGDPTFIIIDEAWIVLGHDVFRDKIREWLKVLRKANCAVVLATQSISDAKRSGIIDVLNESCPTKIFLPNAAAKTDEFGPQYTQLGLNEAQRNIIAGAMPKREYFINTAEGDRLVNLALGPISLAICAKSSKKDIQNVKSFIEEYGKESWQAYWIEHVLQDYN